MYRYLTLLIFLGIHATSVGQNLRGKWVGYLTTTNGIEQKIYPYEINISNNINEQLTAITFTRFSNQSYSTALASVNFTPKVQLLSIQEIKFEQIHLNSNQQGCLMNNFLTYQNNKGQEILQGTFSAKNATNGNDCGIGTVYLEKDLMQTMTLSFNSKKKDTFTTNNKSTVENKKQSLQRKKMKVNELFSQKTTTDISHTNISDTKNSHKNITQETSQQLPNNTFQNSPPSKPQMPSFTVAKQDHILVPWVLIAREDKLVKKITTKSKNVSIDLLDNGTIDNDTITVYNNKILIVDRKRLSYKATHLELSFTDTITTHELILVANNLGAYPPNTALLIFKDANQKEELFINTNYSQNAKIIIEYQPSSLN